MPVSTSGTSSRLYGQNAAGVWTPVGFAAGNVALPVQTPNTVVTGTITAPDAVVGAPAGAGALLSGTSTAGSYVAAAVTAGMSDMMIQLTGATFGGGTVYFELSADSTNGVNGNWITTDMRQSGIINTTVGVSATAASDWRGTVAGSTYVRARMVGGASPSVPVTINLSAAPGGTFMVASIPAGANNIGSVNNRDGAGAALTSTLTNARQALDVNLASTAGAMPVAAGALTATTPQTTGGTANTTAMIVAPVAAAGNATITLNATAFVGSIAFEASDDGGTTYYSVTAAREDGSGQDVIFPVNTAALLTRMWTLGLPGVTHFRVRCSAFTSGSAAIRISPGPFLIEPNPITTMTVTPGATIGAAAGNIGAPAYLSIATVTNTTLIAAPAAGLSIYVTDMEGSNGAAAATSVTWYEGAGTTARFTRYMAASGGGFVTNLRTPWKLPAATALSITQSAANQGYYTASYYIAP